MPPPHLFSRIRELSGRKLADGLPWSRELEKTSCERCGSRTGASHLQFSPVDDTAGRNFLSVRRQWPQRRWPVLPVVARSERAMSMPTCPPAKVLALTCRLPTCRVQASRSRWCQRRYSTSETDDDAMLDELYLADAAPAPRARAAAPRPPSAKTAAVSSPAASPEKPGLAGILATYGEPLLGAT